MAHFRPDPDSLRSLDYTPRFYCRACGAAAPAVRLSEFKVEGGVVRELECAACRRLERVGIRLAEDSSGWVLFQAEMPAPEPGEKRASPAEQEN